MPAYGFKKLFCPFVKEGSKPHTIRAYRKYPVNVGDTLSLYFGMRTKYCTLLRSEICTDVKTIAITEAGTVVIIHVPRLPPNEVEALQISLLALDSLAKATGTNPYNNDLSIGRHTWTLLSCDKDRLAWKDGFRPPGSSLDNPTGAFSLMMDFWRDSHAFPFVGNIIYWEPKN